MSRATLKKSLGEGGAFIDDSHGEDNLIAILTALANSGDSLSVKEAVATTGIKASMVMDVASRIGTLFVNVGTTGTAGQTDVEVRVDGAIVADSKVSVLNTDADGTALGVEVNEDVEVGALVEIDFTAVASNNANVTATLRVKPITVEV